MPRTRREKFEMGFNKAEELLEKYINKDDELDQEGLKKEAREFILECAHNIDELGVEAADQFIDKCWGEGADIFSWNLVDESLHDGDAINSILMKEDVETEEEDHKLGDFCAKLERCVSIYEKEYDTVELSGDAAEHTDS